MRNRIKQRQLFREKILLDKQDICGKPDLTPHNASRLIKGRSVNDIVLK